MAMVAFAISDSDRNLPPYLIVIRVMAYKVSNSSARYVRFDMIELNDGLDCGEARGSMAPGSTVLARRNPRAEVSGEHPDGL